MPKKRHSPGVIIHKLREADVLIAQHKTIAEACKQLGVSEQTVEATAQKLRLVLGLCL